MRNIYIDSDFKCHAANADKLTAVETDFFDGKCDIFVEGYRFVPAGESWTRADGVVFSGEMVAPLKDYAELDNAQREYEKQLLTEYEAALAEMQANSIPTVDLEAAYLEGVNSV